MSTLYNDDDHVWRNVEPVHRLRQSLGSFIHYKLRGFESDRILEVNYDTQQRSTAGEVLKWSTNAAINLERLGVRKGDVVVFFCHYNSQVVPLFYGCYMIGAVVNCFDVLLGEDITANVFKTLKPRVIIYAEEYDQKVKRCLEDDSAIIIPTSQIASQLFKENLGWERYEPEDLGDPQVVLATILMSSGSTGAPKMVTLSHSLLYYGINSMYSRTEPGDRIFATAPIRWITQYSLLHKPVFNGVVRICTGQATDSQRLCDIIKNEQVSHLVANLNMAYDLFDHLDIQGNFRHLGSISHILLGGDCVPDAMIDTIIRKLPKVIPIKCYGMSELGGIAASNESTGNLYLNGGAFSKGVSVKILDFDGRRLSYNKKGRIFLNIGIRFLGYFETDSNAFQENWLETGDYGFVDKDNYLHLVGRCKDIIYHKDIEIIPSAIQAVLNFHDTVKTSIVLGIGSERNPVIFVILSCKGKSLENPSEVKKILMNYLGSSSLPKDVLNVLKNIEIMESIPMLTTGKYDKVELARLYLRKINC